MKTHIKNVDQPQVFDLALKMAMDMQGEGYCMSVTEDGVSISLTYQTIDIQCVNTEVRDEFWLLLKGFVHW